MTSTLLLFNLEKKIASKQNNDDNNLDLLNYIKAQISIDGLRTEISGQIESKITICDNILGETSNIGRIFTCAQHVLKSKIMLQEKIGFLLKTMPDYCLEPLLLYAGYSLILDDSPENCIKYNNMYTQKLKRYKESFRRPTLTNENLYQESNAFMIVSGERSSYGQIVFCSNSIVKLLGGKLETYIGSNITTLFSPSLKPFYKEMLRGVFEADQEALLKEKEQVLLRHKDGHIIEAELYMRIHPYLMKGVYLDLIIRSIPSQKEYLLVKEDGNVEGITRVLANALRIETSLSTSPLLNLKMLSEELWKIYQGFNKMNDDGNDQNELSPRKSLSIFRSVSDVPSPKKYNEGKLDYSFTSKVKAIRLVGTPFQNISIQLSNRRKTATTYHTYDVRIKMCKFEQMRLVELSKVNSNGESESECEKENSPALSENFECSENVNIYATGTNLKLTENNMNTNADLLSPSSSRRNLRLAKENTDFKLSPLPTTEDKLKFRSRRPGSLITSMINHASETSQGKTSHQIFRSALAINFRPASFQAICLLFYGVIMVTFFSQVILKIISDNTMRALVVKKNLLTYNQMRTFKMLQIEINSRGAVNTIINTVTSGETILGILTLRNSIKGHSTDLKGYNQKILNATNSLDKKLNQNLFSKDLRVYGSNVDSYDPSYRNITSFGLIDEVIDSISILNSLNNPNSMEGLHAFNFIVRNTMDDYLYKSQQITNLFVDSVQTERQYFETSIILFLIITPLLLFGILLMLILIIFRQYATETRNMQAFIGLKPKSVQAFLKKLKILKKNLEERDYSDYKKSLEEASNNLNMNNEDDQKGSSHKRRHSPAIDYSEIRSRYLKYVLKATFYIMILIGVMVFNFVSAEKSAKVIYRRQSQLEFANDISQTSIATWCINAELFMTNNQAPVNNTKPLPALLAGLQKLTQLQSNLAEGFLEEDRTYDPTIEGMLFHFNTCEQYQLQHPVYLSYCQWLLKNGYEINMMSVVALYQRLLQDKIITYQNCNKSTSASLVQCLYRDVDTINTAWAAAAAEAQSVGAVVAKNLEKNVSDTFSKRNLFLVLFSVSLAIVSLLIWMHVLIKIRDAYNDFRKVLQVFPPDLIKSSSLLKNYVLQHSQFYKTDLGKMHN